MRRLEECVQGLILPGHVKVILPLLVEDDAEHLVVCLCFYTFNNDVTKHELPSLEHCTSSRF